MSFTLDGHTIETIPGTMVRLACDGAEMEIGVIEVGTYVACTSCTNERGGVVMTFCRVTETLDIPIVPTTHI